MLLLMITQDIRVSFGISLTCLLNIVYTLLAFHRSQWFHKVLSPEIVEVRVPEYLVLFEFAIRVQHGFGFLYFI